MTIDKAAMLNLCAGIERARVRVIAAAERRAPDLHNHRWAKSIPSRQTIEVWNQTYKWHYAWYEYGLSIHARCWRGRMKEKLPPR